MNALYLRGGAEPVLALFHPAGGDTGVLLCPPFGWDDVCSYRSRREWAIRLAGDGYPALRIDLPGTGDSGGSPTDSGLLDAWTEAVEQAALWLRAEGACRRTVAIGIGLGGILAVRAAANGAPIADLVLWAVPARGRALVRELRAFARLETASLVEAGAPKPPPLPDGALAPGGFLLTAETSAALQAVDLTAVSLPPRKGRRALLLGRDGIGVDESLRQALVEVGMNVTVGQGEGYGAMMVQPDHARVPAAVFDRVAEWLGPPERRPAAPSLERTNLERAVVAPTVQERPFVLEQPSGRLFGVLAEPVGIPALGFCVVFLNAAANRRIGPNRMWTDIARRWTARGAPTLRLDMEGIGDADGDSDRYSDVRELYVPRFVAQVRAALDALEAQGQVPRFVLVGLCSGAYWGFHAALEDARVCTALMLNPRVLFWSDELEPVRDLRRIRRRFLRSSAWRRVARGEILIDAARLRSIARAAALSPLRLASSSRESSQDEEVAHAFEHLREAGRRAVFVFCDGEPLREELEATGLLARLDEWPNVSFESIPGRDHTMRPLWMHSCVHAAVDRAFDAELERLAPRTKHRPYVPRSSSASAAARD